MSVVLVLAATGLMVFPGAVRRRVSQPTPAERARLQLISLLTGMVSLGAALTICAAPVVFHTLRLQPIGFLGARHFFPGGPIVGWVSLAVLVPLVVLAASAMFRHFRRHRRLREEAHIVEPTTMHGATVHILPTDVPLTFALPGNGGIVVVSRGVIDRLDPAEISVVIRHERSHLAHHHEWYLLAADLVDRVFGMVPAVAKSTNALRLAVEQWADQDAVLVPTDRLVISGAMRRIIGLPPGPTLAAFAQADLVASRLLYLEGDIDTPSIASRLLVYVATSMCLALAIAPLVVWSL